MSKCFDLKSIPKNTPPWALGLTVFITALFAGVGTLYVLSRDEVKQVLNNTAAGEVRETNALASVLGMLNANTEQLTIMSRTLASTQSENLNLNRRVDALEVSVSELKGSLTSCEGRLKSCKKF